MHDRYKVQYQPFQPDVSFTVPGWLVLSDQVALLHKIVDAPSLWIELFNKHAWFLGTCNLIETYEYFFDRIEPEARGSFMAGAIEAYDSEEHAARLLKYHHDLKFSHETLCQVACLAAMYSSGNEIWQLVFDAVIETEQDLTLAVDRVKHKSIFSEDDPVEHLSQRAIDIILEAAISFNSPKCAQKAIEKGADPNIPIWILERSYNEKHTALSHAIAKGDDEIAEMLMKAGAHDRGSDFAPESYALSQAVLREKDSIAKRLILKGTPIGPRSSAGPEYRTHRHRAVRLEFIKDTIGQLIPLWRISEKRVFYYGHAQGGFFYTILDIVISDVERLESYERAELDIRLTPEEIVRAINYDNLDGLAYLFTEYGEDVKDKAMRYVHEFKSQHDT